jgi:hypothetical protein
MRPMRVSQFAAEMPVRSRSRGRWAGIDPHLPRASCRGMSWLWTSLRSVEKRDDRVFQQAVIDCCAADEL